MPAETNVDYGRRDYWEDRFTREEAGFEWLGPYSVWRDRIMRILDRLVANRRENYGDEDHTFRKVEKTNLDAVDNATIAKDNANIVNDNVSIPND